MAGISRLSALLIQGGTLGEDITVDASGPNEGGKWSFWITFWKNNRPHIAPLISSEFFYPSSDEAKQAGVELVESVKRMDVL